MPASGEMLVDPFQLLLHACESSVFKMAFTYRNINIIAVPRRRTAKLVFSVILKVALSK